MPALALRGAGPMTWSSGSGTKPSVLDAECADIDRRHVIVLNTRLEQPKLIEGEMKGFVYRNIKSIVWGDVHKTQPRGMAYETDKHFVHVYGKADGLWVVSNGLTIAEVKQGTLQDWIVNNFGAVEIEECSNTVGATTKGVWRPGLFYDDEILQG